MKTICTCPRCGDPFVEEHGALSRADNETYVCSGCGAEEAGVPPAFVLACRRQGAAWVRDPSTRPVPLTQADVDEAEKFIARQEMN